MRDLRTEAIELAARCVRSVPVYEPLTLDQQQALGELLKDAAYMIRKLSDEYEHHRFPNGRVMSS